MEHFPGTALPTVSETLAFLQGVDHPNLYLLFDTGHAQISGEEMVATIKAAGPQLGYVHLNDNDGLGDFHLPLLDGIIGPSGSGADVEGPRRCGIFGTPELRTEPESPESR